MTATTTGNDRHGVPLAEGDHVLVVPLGRETFLPYAAVVDGFAVDETQGDAPMVHLTPDSPHLRRMYESVKHLPTLAARCFRLTDQEAREYHDLAHEARADRTLRRALRDPATPAG
jgi:hypothetical protein